jgi:nucleotide-binding universal stress UspA family protein
MEFKKEEEVHQPDSAFNPSRTICFPIDNSAQSLKTIEYALSKVITKNDLIILLHSRSFFDVSESGPYQLPRTNIEEIEQNNRLHSIELLKTTAGMLNKKGIQVRAFALEGETRRELQKKINELKPDFVVMGSRGLGAIRRFMLGSVTDHMIHHLQNIPVMIVPQE